MTRNKNEQIQDAKDNAELHTKWKTKADWKTFEQTIRWGGNRSIKAQLVTEDDTDDDGVIVEWLTLMIHITNAPCPNLASDTL